MSVIDSLISIIAPYDCVGCGGEGSLLCPSCRINLPPPQLQKHANSSLRHIQSATLYQGAAKDLIWKLKSGGAQAAAKIMARQMARLLKTNNQLIVPVPTATSRVRQRGYDQAKLIAKELARQTRLEYVDCLARHGQTHQVGASRKERLRQLSEAFRITKPRLVYDSRIVLVDDVTTTGATLETAAVALSKAGASKIEALTFAYKPKDS
jgi:ComF family protein